MATSKTKPRPKPQDLSKAMVTKLAAARREGAAWTECEELAKFKVHTTTPRDWAAAFESNGFNKFGVHKGSGQKSKARGWSPAQAKAVAARNGGSSKAGK